MIYIGTAITENYIDRAIQYLQSLNKYSDNVKPFCITLGFNNDKLEKYYPNIMFIYKDIASVSCLNKNYCIQEGSFINELYDNGVKDDDTIIFTDADGYIVRNLTDKELFYFNNIEDKVITSWNAGREETISDEVKNLSPKLTFIDDYLNNVFSINVKELKCYNTGFIATKAYNWKHILKQYNENFTVIDNFIEHYAKQQLLLSIIFQVCFTVEVAPYSIHTHGHYGKPDAVTIKDNILYEGGEVVYFRHKL